VENWHKRLKEVREKHDKTQQDLAAILKKDVTRMSRYERGDGAKNMPAFMKRGLIEIFSPEEIAYIEHGDNAPSMTVMEPLINYGKEEIIMLDYYPESYASAGGGAYPYLQKAKPMSFSKSFLEIHLGLISYKNIFILNTTGESMEPTLKDGSLIFVNPIENEDGHVRDGGIYVIMCDNTILVKRVTHNPIAKTYTLISDNPVHESIVVDAISFSEEDCKFIGRVVGSFDRV